MKTKTYASCLLIALLTLATHAAIIKYDNNGSGTMNDATRWIGGVVPGADDIAWIESTTGGLSVSITQDMPLGGIYFFCSASDAKNGTPSIGSGNGKYILLGRYGLFVHGTGQKTIGSIKLMADQTWTFSGGGSYQTGGTVNSLNGYTLTWQGGTGKYELKHQTTGPGTIIAEPNASYNFSGGVLPTGIDYILNRSGTTFNMGYYKSGVDSFKSFTANCGSDWRIDSNAGFHGSHHITEDLTINGGLMTFSLNQSSAYRGLLAARALIINDGALFLRGNNFTTINSTTADQKATGCTFDTPPTLSGQSGGTGTQCPILPGVIVATNNNSAAGADGLATYDATLGVRALDPNSEYINTLTSGSATLDNIRILTPGTTTLADPLTTVNSLSIEATGTANAAAITVAGDPDSVLAVNSGHIFLKQTTASPTANDGIRLTVPALDFGGANGKIFLGGITTSGSDYGAWAGAAAIQSIPQNVGPQGIGFYGAGSVRIEGDLPNTYQGNITVGNGTKLHLNRATPNTAVYGALIVNGGTCHYNKQLAPEADVIVYEGTSEILSGTTTAGIQDYRDLFVYGGLHKLGNGGVSSSTHRNASLYKGKYNLAGSATATLTGDLLIAGGLLDLSQSSPGLTVGGETIISNPVTMAYNVYNTTDGSTRYTAMSIARASALKLGSRLSFYGNNNNNATALIAASLAGSLAYPIMTLTGDTTFDINDGDADTDLEIQVTLANGITAGKLIKRGAGTLLLSAPTNTLTGGIVVDDGTLIIAGYQNGDITVADGGTLSNQGDSIINGDLTFQSGGRYAFTEANALHVHGNITSETPVPVTCRIPTDPNVQILVMTATGQLNAAFASPDSRWRFVKIDNSIYLKANRATRINLY